MYIVDKEGKIIGNTSDLSEGWINIEEWKRWQDWDEKYIEPLRQKYREDIEKQLRLEREAITKRIEHNND